MTNFMAAGLIAKAAKLYAAAPSHAPSDGWPEPGTVCAIWAIDEARDTEPWSAVHVAIEAVEYACYGTRGTESIVDYNAEHTTEEMLAVFAKAEAELCR